MEKGKSARADFPLLSISQAKLSSAQKRTPLHQFFYQENREQAADNLVRHIQRYSD